MVDDAHGQRPYIHITHYLRLSEGGVTYYSVLTSIIAGRNSRKLESFFFFQMSRISMCAGILQMFFFFFSFFLVRWGVVVVKVQCTLLKTQTKPNPHRKVIR